MLIHSIMFSNIDSHALRNVITVYSDSWKGVIDDGGNDGVGGGNDGDGVRFYWRDDDRLPSNSSK